VLTTLVDVRPLGVHVVLDAYPTLLYGGALLGIFVALAVAGVRGLPVARAAAVLAAAAIAVPVGARAMHVFTDITLFADDPASALSLSLTGFGIYGGLTAAVVAAAVGALIAHIDLWRLADAAAPGVALGLTLAKLGCYCEGCCHGVVTRGPFGAVFPTASPAHVAQIIDGSVSFMGAPLPVYPTQLYEAGGAFVLGILALVLARWLPDGVAFLGLAAGFSAVRLAVLRYRWIEPSFSAPGWFYPALYGAIIALCIAFIAARWLNELAVSSGANTT